MEKIKTIIEQKAPTLSFEVFPPKIDKALANLIYHLEMLSHFKPDFISVTYGAGGTNQNKSIETLEQIHAKFDTTIIAHFTCIGLDYQKIDIFTELLEKLGITNILALRGDPPNDISNFDFSRNVFEYASNLVSYLKSKTKLCIGVAAYPEGHPSASSKEIDWDNLKKKVDEGADYIITQLFFNNSDFFKFIDELNKRNINIPVIPGILPVSSIDVLTKAVNLSGAKFHPKLKEITQIYANNPEDFQKASIDFSYNQVKELLKTNAKGIHFYILNRSEMMLKLLPLLSSEFCNKF